MSVAENADARPADPAVASAAPKLQRRMAELMARHHLPGASVGVVRDQALVWTAGFGFADLQTKQRPDEHTVYRVASISKTFTAAAIVQLRDQGRLRLDDPLVQYIPEFAGVRCRQGTVEGVTFRRLLSHRSGLMSEGPFSYWDSMQFPTMAEILAALPRTEVVLLPDAGAKYSNLAFALMGEVVARLSGKPFERYVADAIFDPLGMTSSSFTPDDALLARMATGYSPHPFEDYPEPSGHTPSKGIAAAAGLYTTATDLARWIGLQFRAARPAVGLTASPTDDEQPEASDGQVLASRSLDEMHTPRAIDLDWTEARCLGWFGMRRGENVYLGHGGSQHGFITQIRFHMPTRTGVIVLTNEGRHDVAGLASIDLLELLLPAVRDAQSRSSEPTPTPTPQDLKRFLGRYQLWAGALSHVEFRDGALRLAPAPPDQAALHAPAKLAPTADPLVFRVMQSRGAGELAVFSANAEGAITGFSLSGFSYRKLQ